MNAPSLWLANILVCFTHHGMSYTTV